MPRENTEATPRASPIKRQAEPAGKGILLTVADDGIGIPAEERDNVLRRFYRVDAARSTQGSGLGLSMVAAIARYHGAALKFADNRPGLRAVIHFAQF